MAPRKGGKSAQKRRATNTSRVVKKSRGATQARAAKQARVAKQAKRTTSQKRSGTGSKTRTATKQTVKRTSPQRASRRAKLSPKQRAEQEHRAELKRRLDNLFEQQIDSLWGNLGSQCRDFAEGYNLEIGAQHLDVQQHPDGVLVKFSESGGEVGIQLDREHRNVTCYLHSGWTKLGSSTMESPPIGLTIQDGQLRLVYSGNIISEEDLAVRLLTDLTGGESTSSA